MSSQEDIDKLIAALSRVAGADAQNLQRLIQYLSPGQIRDLAQQVGQDTSSPALTKVYQGILRDTGNLGSDLSAEANAPGSSAVARDAGTITAGAKDQTAAIQRDASGITAGEPVSPMVEMAGQAAQTAEPAPPVAGQPDAAPPQSSGQPGDTSLLANPKSSFNTYGAGPQPKPGDADPSGGGGVFYTAPDGGTAIATQGTNPVYADEANLADYISRARGISQDDLRKDYVAANEQYQTAQDHARARGYREEGSDGQQTYGQWLTSQSKLLNGSYQYILSDYAQKFALQFGYEMPPELMSRLLRKIQAMPAFERSSLLLDYAPTVTDAQGKVTAQDGQLSNNKTSPFLDQEIAEYTKTHATGDVLKDSQFSSLQGQLTDLLGTPPDDALVRKLLDMPLAEREKAIENLPMPGDPGHTVLQHAQIKKERASIESEISQRTGQPANSADVDKIMGLSGPDRLEAVSNLTMPGTHLTVGQYETAKSSIESQWSKYFNDKPKTSDIEWAAGFRDQQSLNDAILHKPSHIPGMDVGTRENYQQYTDQLRTKLWNVGTDTDFVNLVHQGVQQQDAKPDPQFRGTALPQGAP